MLNHWFVARVDFSSHSEFVLGGFVYGRRNLRDGHPALTSSILELSDDDSWARTLNTLYRLHERAVSGETDRDWKLRLLLFAVKRLVAPVTLQGVDVHVDWPYVRSPAAKFGKRTTN
jgi:hypothetical protein